MSDEAQFHDDEATDKIDPTADSGILDAAVPAPGFLQIYHVGETTVVGFGEVDLPDDLSVTGYREQLGKLVEEHNCRYLAFDLSGVRTIPSGMLGLLTSLNNQGVHVELFNPSVDVREVLEITRLTDSFPIRRTTESSDD